MAATTQKNPLLELEYLKGRAKEKFTEQIKLNDFVDIKGWKARGNRLSQYRVTYVDILKNDPVPVEQESQTLEQQKSETDQSLPENKKDQLDLF